MHREPSDRVVFADEAMRDALRELRAAGDHKRYLDCRFGLSLTSRLVEIGWATLDGVPIQKAWVRLTPKGRAAIAKEH